MIYTPQQQKTTQVITDSFINSNYFISASGFRNVSYSELSELISIVRFRKPSLIEEDLKILFRQNPDTILMSKELKKTNCHKFNEDFCDCFLPGVEFENCFCKKTRAEYLSKTDYRNTPEYKKWRSSVFEKDCYTCQECGVSGGELNAHHVKKFKDYPESRYETDNGKTLCVACHKKEHGGAKE